MQKIRKAVLPVAGVGTRFLPATAACPKELFPIVDKPVLHLLVEEALSAGVEEICFVISREKESIRDYFSDKSELAKLLESRGKSAEAEEIHAISRLAKFHFVYQDEPLGDGHAILQARDFVGNEPFLVLFGDDLVRGEVSAARQLVEIYERENSSVVVLTEVEPIATSQYGIVSPKSLEAGVAEIDGFVEKPRPEDAPSRLAIIGKYVCTPEIFPILESSPSGSGEIRLIDALTELLSSQQVFGKVVEGQRYDTGDKFGFVQAVIAESLESPATAEKMRKHLLALASQIEKA